MGGNKGGDKKVVVGYDYYASFAGVFGFGPADELLEVIIDSQSEWKPASPVLRSASANPYVFTIPGRAATGRTGKSYPGKVYFYWGTETQTLSDPVLTKPGRNHPPYRRRIVAVFQNFFCGFERQSVPNIQVVVLRGAVQEVLTADLISGHANPLAAAAEWLTHPVTGLGLPLERLHLASWASVGAALAAEASTEYLSVKVDAARKARDLLTDLRDYADVWFRMGTTGQIEVGRALIGEEPPDLPVLTHHALTEPPQVEAVEPGELADRVNLKYTSEANAYQQRIARFDDPLGRIQTDGERDREITLPWITRDAQAGAKVAQIGQQEAEPYWEASLSVRFATWWALGLQVGDAFVLEYAPLAFRAVLRAEQVNGFGSGGGPVKVRAVSERRLRPTASASGVDGSIQETLAPPTASPFLHVLQAPPVAAGGDAYTLIALAGVLETTVRYATLWWRRQASEDFTELATIVSFAVPVQLAAALSDSGPDDDETGGIQIEQYDPAPLGFDGIPGTQSEEEILADTLLLIVIDATDPQRFEILTVKSLESPSGSAFPVYARRARLGTAKQAFASGSPAYVVYRSQLQQLASPAFETIANTATEAERTAVFALQPVNAAGALDLADAPEFSLELLPQLTDAIILDGDAAV